MIHAACGGGPKSFFRCCFCLKAYVHFLYKARAEFARAIHDSSCEGAALDDRGEVISIVSFFI